MTIKRNPGGLAEKKDFTEKDADPKQLKMGIKVEMEHTTDPAKAAATALDHLAESKDYYTRLKVMETDIKKFDPEEEDRRIDGENAMDKALAKADRQTKSTGKGRAQIALREFLRDNPKPSDKQFHELAEKLGVEVDWLEAQAYSLASQTVRAEKGGQERTFTMNEAYAAVDSGMEKAGIPGGSVPPDSGLFAAQDQAWGGQVGGGPAAGGAVADSGLYHSGIGQRASAPLAGLRDLDAFLGKSGNGSSEGAGHGKVSTPTYQHHYTQGSLKGDSKMVDQNLEKAGPYIGPKGGKWADAQHTIPYKEGGKVSASPQKISARHEQVRAAAAAIPKMIDVARGKGDTAEVEALKIRLKALHEEGTKLSGQLGDIQKLQRQRSVSAGKPGSPEEDVFAQYRRQQRVTKSMEGLAEAKHEATEESKRYGGDWDITITEKSQTAGIDALEDHMRKADDGKPGESLEETSDKELKATAEDIKARLKDDPEDKALQARAQAIAGELKKRGGGGDMDKCDMAKKSGDSLDALEDYMVKAGQALPTHAAGLGHTKSDAVEGGSADGGSLEGKGKGGGPSGPYKPGPTDSLKDSLKDIKKKEKLSEDDEDEEGQMKPHKKPIETIGKTQKSQPHPYALSQVHPSDEDVANFAKSEDFYVGGSPQDTAPVPTCFRGHLCKSCGCSHAAGLTACPNCGDGAVVHQVTPIGYTGGNGLRLRKSEADIIVK